jgi:hypothetical protein
MPEKHQFGKEFFKNFANMLRTGNFVGPWAKKRGAAWRPTLSIGALREAPLGVVM